MATSSKSALLYLGACFAFLSSSCSLALNLGENQCDKDADCTNRGFENAICQDNTCVVGMGSSSASTGTGGNMPQPGWECLGHFQYPDPMGMTVKQDFVFLDALSQQPVTSITMKLCGPLDALCTAPSMTDLKPDAMGKLTLDVPMMPGFYLDITDDNAQGAGGAGGGGPGPTTYRPSLAYVGSPIVIPPTLKTIRLITNAGLAQLAGALNVNEDTTHGIIVGLTPNCEDQRSPGVVVTTSDVDAETQILYFKNSVPSKTATSTDAEGAVGIFNLPAGTPAQPRTSTFTTRLQTPECSADPTSCQAIGTASVFVRPSSLTYVHIGPSP